MIDPALLKNDEGLKLIEKSLKRRAENDSVFLKLSELTDKRRELMMSSESLQSKRNALSKEIGQIQKSEPQKAEQLKEEVRSLGDELKKQKEDLGVLNEEYESYLLLIPNILDEETPDGADESANQIIHEKGKKPEFAFTVKPHFEIAENLELVDFARGVKLSGSRFYVYNEEISRLERKLIDFLLTKNAQKGYKEKTVPFLVADHAMLGTGQLPKFAGEFYHIENDDLNLIPTGEVPLTNLYADEILAAENLPVYLMGATPCFRREAGSAGKDTRGLIRVHQFQKVELVKLVKPETSEEELQKLVSDVEDILESFGLHFRRVLLCSGDTSFSSAKTYDLEVWLPGMQRWMEISSCSNFRDFQARRCKIRFKNPASQKNELVHTLNGSGVALGRLIAALLEYFQTPDGKVDFEKIYSFMN